jgi:hypothetical protein
MGFDFPRGGARLVDKLCTTMYRFLADAVLMLHFAFVAFVLLGGLLLFRWRRLVWLHLPAAAWGVAIMFGGWICPLTPLENRLRRLAGESGIEGGFIEHYMLPLLYPSGLTRGIQMSLGLLALLLNLFVYFRIYRRAPSTPS